MSDLRITAPVRGEGSVAKAARDARDVAINRAERAEELVGEAEGIVDDAVQAGALAGAAAAQPFAQTATQAAQQADSSANAASLSALQALLAAGPRYDDVASGLAAVADGETFYVIGDDEAAFATFYRRQGSVAVLLSSYPSAAAVLARLAGLEARIDVQPSAQASFRIETQSGSVLVTWYDGEGWRFGNVEVDALTAASVDVPVIAPEELRFGDASLAGQESDDTLLDLELQDGRRLYRFGRDGLFEAPSAEVRNLTVTESIIAPNFGGLPPLVPAPMAQATLDLITAQAGTANGGPPLLSVDAENWGWMYSLLMGGVAVTGQRIWVSDFGQNWEPTKNGEGPGRFSRLFYSDGFEEGATWRFALAFPPRVPQEGGMYVNPVTMPDGRLLIVANVQTTGNGWNVWGLIVNNPRARVGSFLLGRWNYLGRGVITTSPATINGQLYSAYWAATGAGVTPYGVGRFDFPAGDQVTWTPIATWPAIPGETAGPIEPALMALNGGRGRVIFRSDQSTNGGAGFGFMETTSDVNFQNWSTPVVWSHPNVPANANNGMLQRIEGGRIVFENPRPNGSLPALCKSPTTGLLYRLHCNTPLAPRGRMTLAASADDGETWPVSRVLALPTNVTGLTAVYGAVTCTDDGRVVATWDERVEVGTDYIRGAHISEDDFWAGTGDFVRFIAASATSG